MAIVNYETLADFEVATAADAQRLFMDQSIVKVDADADLAGLPNSVKTAYVLNTGILMARDVANAWKPQGGAATVSETAPSNPQLGALWVKPSEVLPLPIRTYWGTTTITSTAYADQSGRSVDFVTPKAVMVNVSWGGNLNGQGSAQTDYFHRLAWTGALTGDSTFTSLIQHRTYGTEQVFTSKKDTFTIVCPSGTTTFKLQAYHTSAGTTHTLFASHISITPIAWADAYAAGVS